MISLLNNPPLRHYMIGNELLTVKQHCSFADPSIHGEAGGLTSLRIASRHTPPAGLNRLSHRRINFFRELFSARSTYPAFYYYATWLEMTHILRSLLFVPGDSQSKIAKAVQVPADVLILDWEDAVLSKDKASARVLTIDFLKHRTIPQPVFIRFNPAGTRAFEEDCLAVRECVPVGVVLSKCRSAEDIQKLHDLLDAIDPAHKCGICPLVESPKGVLQAPSIASASNRVTMVAFGAEDFSAEMHIIRTAEELELLYARSFIVAACRAAGKEPIDSPCLELRDPECVRTAAHKARNMGFSGKLAIHPNQISIINETFSPSEAEVREARHIVEVMSEAPTGVFTVDGRMVDEAIVRRARSILELIDGGSPERRT
jgi:citrate lyase subunit beta/citryl-CoA lyase